tara:strand:+ start:118 stop:411 length:294 start_codon:yes stop_codon:yes gene_type:complete
MRSKFRSGMHTGATSSVRSDCNGVVGDINGDGVITVQDAIVLINCILDQNCHQITNGECGDLNQDGAWNVIDVVSIVNHILKQGHASAQSLRRSIRR